MTRGTIALVAILAACGDAGVVTITGTTSTTVEVETTFTLSGAEAESTFTTGDVVAVIGAADDVTHWLVGLPGDEITGGVVRELQPTETGLVALGIAWKVEDVLWERLRLGEHEGWFPRPMLGFIGEPDDVTALFVGVSSESVEDLGAEIAAEIEAAEVVLVDEVGRLEVVYDVIGLEDDPVAGYRIRIVASEEAGRFTPALVERTPLCSHGIGGDGLCL